MRKSSLTFICAHSTRRICALETRNETRQETRQETNRNEWRVVVKWGKGYVDRDRLFNDLSYVRHCERKPNPFLDFRRDMRRVFDLFDCLIDWLLQDGDEADSQVMICRILRERQRMRERTGVIYKFLDWFPQMMTLQYFHAISTTLWCWCWLLPHCVARADWQLSWDRNRGSHWKLLLLLRDSGDLTNPNIWHAKLATTLCESCPGD